MEDSLGTGNKRIQGLLLEILKAVDEICSEANCSYMLTQGTLLGAVRERGFIEWDIEDGDVMMHRKDFEVFMAYCSRCLCDLPFIPAYDEGGLIPRLTLRRDSGIFVEIILIDSLPEIEWKRQLKIFLLRLINAMLRQHNTYANHSLGHNVKSFVIWCFGRLFPTETKRALYRRMSRSSNEQKSGFIHFSNESQVRMVCEFKRDLLQETIRTRFEDLELLIPREWDTVLRFYYGDDYMIPKRENYMAAAGRARSR